MSYFYSIDSFLVSFLRYYVMHFHYSRSFLTCEPLLSTHFWQVEEGTAAATADGSGRQQRHSELPSCVSCLCHSLTGVLCLCKQQQRSRIFSALSSPPRLRVLPAPSVPPQRTWFRTAIIYLTCDISLTVLCHNIHRVDANMLYFQPSYESFLKKKTFVNRYLKGV